MDNRRKQPLVQMMDELDGIIQNIIRQPSDDSVFLKFVINQEECRKKWLASTEECERLKVANKKLEDDLAAAETRLKHCRNCLTLEMTKRSNVQKDKDHFERQVERVKEFLHDEDISDLAKDELAFLDVPPPSKRNLKRHSKSTMSIVSEISIDADDTTDSDLSPEMTKKYNSYREPRKRLSSSPLTESTSPKQTKPDRVMTGNYKPVIAVTSIPDRNQRSLTLGKQQAQTGTTPSKTATLPRCRVTFHVPLNSEGTTEDSEGATSSSEMSASTNARITIKCHNYRPKKILMPENCVHCNKRLLTTSMASKCADCGAIRCLSCRLKSSTPCLPAFKSPTTKVGKVIGDFAPPTVPAIPPLVMLCVTEVERRGLNIIHLYNNCGVKEEIAKLKGKLLSGRKLPNLNGVNVRVICGCLREFFDSLREPLITHTFWHDFANIIEISNKPEDICGFVSILPDANKHTLAYLMIHLRLIARTAGCEMSVDSLIRIFSSSIVGYSCPRPEPSAMIAERDVQLAVMKRLLAVPDIFWSKILETTNAPVHFNSLLKSRKDSKFGLLNGVKKTKQFGLREDKLKTEKRQLGFK